MCRRGLRFAVLALALPAAGCLATKPYVKTEVGKSEARTQEQLQVFDQRLDTIERELGEEKARLGTLETDVHQTRAVAEETAKKADQARELVIKAGPKVEGPAREAPPTVGRVSPPKPLEPATASPESLVIHFGTGQWQLDHQARLALLKALKRLREDPSIRVKLEGHADNVGSTNQNQELSQRRADEVRRFLVGSGIKPNRIEVQALGEARPVASNRSPTGRDQNRRVAVTLLPATR